MPGILSTNNPVVKVSGIRPSTLTTGLLELVLSALSVVIIPGWKTKALKDPNFFWRW